MVKIDDIILAEIDKNVLTIYTVNNTYTMRETLTNFQHRINRRSFLQIITSCCYEYRSFGITIG